MREPIYLDYQSTTPVDPRVVNVMTSMMSHVYGNPSSVDHIFGQRAAQVVEDSRKSVASLVGASRGKVIFTSGATEAINIVINHVVTNHSAGKPAKIALLPVEHSAVLETCLRFQSSHGTELFFLEVDSTGSLVMESLKAVLAQRIDLVCVMGANNEIGTVYPIRNVAELCASSSTPFLCDASQAAGRIEIEFDNWSINYLVVSGHKMQGPKGIGAVITKRNALPDPLVSGGGQEFGSRPGTLNLPAIAGLAEACRLRLLEMSADEIEIAKKRDSLQRKLKDSVQNLWVSGCSMHRLAGVLHISVPGIPNDAVISRVRDKLAISRGAACSSGLEKPSHVLTAIGFDDALIEGSLRIGIGKFTTDEEINEAAIVLADAIAEVQRRVVEVEHTRA